MHGAGATHVNLFSQRDPLDSVSVPPPGLLVHPFSWMCPRWVAASAIPSRAGVFLYFLSLSVGILPATILGHSVGTLDSEPFVCSLIVICEGGSMFCTLLSLPFCSSSFFLAGVFNGLFLPFSLSKPSHASSPCPPWSLPHLPGCFLISLSEAPQTSSPNHRLHAYLLFTPLFPTEQVWLGKETSSTAFLVAFRLTLSEDMPRKPSAWICVKGAQVSEFYRFLNLSSF